MNTLRMCREDDIPTVLAIINAAAEAYRGVIPADRWHDPYMSRAQLQDEIGAGVEFWGLEMAGELIGVMGLQALRDVDLIRHAYVRPDRQRHGVGARLIEHLRQRSARRMLVGTWAAATRAIAFYQRHGFQLVTPAEKAALLRTYWTIPERQIEVSVVLANPAWQS
jgi:N-acetylglutamate synthase-like GNAT family acetyltransferase